MFRNFFGRRARVVEAEEQQGKGAKRNRMVIILIIAAICILVFSGGREEKKEEDPKPDIRFNIEEYTVKTENRLCEALSKIKGAGNVQVMVNYDTAQEKVLAQNIKNDVKEEKDGERDEKSSTDETSVMLYGTGTSQQPYILKEKLPVPSGVLVTADGAGDERVRLEIYEAVKALYGISGHRIKVTAKVSGAK